MPTPFAERARSSGAASASRPIGPPWRAGVVVAAVIAGDIGGIHRGERPPACRRAAFPQHVERRRAGECRGDLSHARPCAPAKHPTAPRRIPEVDLTQTRDQPASTSRSRRATGSSMCQTGALPLAVRPFRQQRVCNCVPPSITSGITAHVVGQSSQRSAHA